MESPEQLRPVGFWDIDYIADLPTVELDWFECKASAWLTLDERRLADLSTYLSAFANYDGGYILLGVQNPRAGLPLKIDEGVLFSLKNGVAEWLEDKLPNLVDRRLPKIRVQTIPLPNDSSRGPVVIYIPPSVEAPHQALDKHFYGRTGSKLNRLGTRAILDIVHRQQHPVLTVRIFFNLWEIDLREPPQSNLRWEVTNNSRVLCRHFGLQIKVPMIYDGKSIIFEPPAYLEDRDGKCFWVITSNNKIDHPLFPKATAGRNISAKFGGSFKDMVGQAPKIATLDAVEIRLFADEARYQDFSFPVSEVLKLHSPG